MYADTHWWRALQVSYRSYWTRYILKVRPAVKRTRKPAFATMKVTELRQLL